MTEPVRVVLVSGSTRAGSTNTAAVRTAAALDVPGVVATAWDRLVDVPAFVPGDDTAPPAVVALRDALTAADAVVFCTPEYAGTLPGSVKNALDWLVGSGELYGKPVAWVTVAAPGRGRGAEATLALVLGYVDADVVDAACVRLPVARDAVGPDGLVHDADVRAGLAAQLAAVAAHVRGAPEKPREELRVEVFTGPREELRGSFALAEDSTDELDAYLPLGTVLVAVAKGGTVGHLQLVDTDPGGVELKNMAVRPDWQGRGVGRRLIAAALAHAAGTATEMLVATGAADVGNLRFYQRQGFRFRSVERDAFTEATGYPPGLEVDGIPLRDRVWLDRPVPGPPDAAS